MAKATSGSQDESNWCATPCPHTFGPLCPFLALPGAIWSDPCTLGKDSNPHPQKLLPPSYMEPSLWPHLASWHGPQLGENNRIRKQVISSEHWFHVFLRWYCAQMRLKEHDSHEQKDRTWKLYLQMGWEGERRDNTTHNWWGPYHLLKTYPHGSRKRVEIDTFLKLLRSPFPKHNQRVRIISRSVCSHITALDLIINSYIMWLQRTDIDLRRPGPQWLPLMWFTSSLYTFWDSCHFLVQHNPI